MGDGSSILIVEDETDLADMLCTMWLQLANLRALKAADDPEASEITGRIRALCGNVAVEISAEREVVKLLEAGS